MKNTLLHIATPIVNILAYVISYAIAKLFFKFLAFISRGVPMDYQSHEDSIVNILALNAIAVICVALTTNIIAPSAKKIHYCVIASLISAMSVTSAFIGISPVLDSVGTLIGAVGGYFALNSLEE